MFLCAPSQTHPGDMTAITLVQFSSSIPICSIQLQRDNMITLLKVRHCWDNEKESSSSGGEVKLFCFHWAGGNVNSYKSWVNTLSCMSSTERIDVYGM